MSTIIRKRKKDPLGDILGGLGMGLSGFAGAKMGRKQMDAAETQAEATQKLMERIFGQGINPMPMQPDAGMAPMGMGAPSVQPGMQNLLQGHQLSNPFFRR